MSLDLPPCPPIPVNERYYARYDSPKADDTGKYIFIAVV